MINVLLLVKRYSGNYPLLNEMAKLDEGRFRCVVCYLGGEKDGQNPLDSRAKTYYLGLKNHEIKLWNGTLRRRLAAIMDAEQIHVVNCHLQRTIAVGIAAARAARSRPAVVATLHGLGSADSWQRKLGNWLLYRHLYKIVGVSEGVRQDLLRNNWHLNPDRVVAIHNGIDTAPFLQPQAKDAMRQRLFPDIQGKIWFGTAGRLTRVKNQKNLLLAFKRCIDIFPESVLLICGRGEAETELRSLTSSLGLDGKVHFLGFRQDIAQVLAALDVFVLPSLREGFGLALVEAMCSGIPVIASQVGGVPEIFGEVAVGELIDPQSVDGLTNAMIRIAQRSDEDRVRLGENARTRVLQNFTAEKMVKGYEELYAAAWRDLPVNRDRRP
ncbi:MAG TPA: glycosyltransferase [Desulfuromonadales bacterium]|nr:glycosyltransferase [Desulfuromonadales bacterium]